MSKEKLKVIKEEYATSYGSYTSDLAFLNYEIDHLMKLAYNQALEDASRNVSLELNNGKPPKIDKQSIEKLKI